MTRNAYRLRKEKKLTQQQVAKRAGISKSFLSKIERGEANPTMDTLDALAAALEVSVQALTAPAIRNDPPPDSIWPDDADVQSKIDAAWRALRACHPSLVTIRRAHEHMPAHWFATLMHARLSDLGQPLRPSDLHRHLGMARAASYRELVRLEKLLLLQPRKVAGRTVVFIGPVGHLWLNEELGLVEGLNPLNHEVTKRFWLKACTWISASSAIAHADVPLVVNQPLLERFERDLQTRFEAALRNHSSASVASSRAAASAIMGTIHRDPLRIVASNAALIGRALRFLSDGKLAEFFDEPFAVEIRALLDQLQLGSTLTPSVTALIRIVWQSALHDLELLEKELRQARRASK